MNRFYEFYSRIILKTLKDPNPLTLEFFGYRFKKLLSWI